MSANVAIQNHPAITPDHLRRRAVVYLRQSTEEQVRENTGSTDFQRGLKQVALSYGWPESHILIIDDDLGKSGSTIEGRTGWDRLQKMIEAGEVGAVFAANISRLARQLLDFEVFHVRAAVHKTLLYHDGRLVNPADSNDAFVSQITAIVAQYENRKRAEIMMQSRLAKAKHGEVVSRLPVGWVKGPDKKYYHDPETKDTIRRIIDIFWQTRSIRRTVIVLAKAGIRIPCRKRRGQLCYAKPTMSRVTFILTHPAYTGTYVFAKTRSQPGGPVQARGVTKRMKMAEDRWIKIYNHHPAYLTLEEQEEIKSILARNQFKRRHRAGRGRALSQGLLRCGACGATLIVSYTRKAYRFVCRRSKDYAEKPCLSFSCNELDQHILREVFKVLKAPPVDMLKAALKASQSKKQTRLNWIEGERERLVHAERLAQEHADLSRTKYPRVHLAALARLECVLEEKEEFELKTGLERMALEKHESEEELEELCRIASELPALWEHEAMSHQERKEILRCLIDHIVVTAGKERVDATIVWKSGAESPVFVWRARSRHHLIRELHEQQLTVAEIRAHLSAGKTSTGQSINISEGGVRISLQRMGLKAARYSASRLAVRRKAAELHAEGRSLTSIAQYFNDQRVATPSGKSWTHFMVQNLLRAASPPAHQQQQNSSGAV